MSKRTVTHLWGVGPLLALAALVAFSAWPAQGQEPETTNVMTSPKEARHE